MHYKHRMETCVSSIGLVVRLDSSQRLPALISFPVQNLHTRSATQLQKQRWLVGYGLIAIFAQLGFYRFQGYNLL